MKTPEKADVDGYAETAEGRYYLLDDESDGYIALFNAEKVEPRVEYDEEDLGLPFRYRDQFTIGDVQRWLNLGCPRDRLWRPNELRLTYKLSQGEAI